MTQIVLGASVAEATLGKKIGRHSLWWGALVGTLPDLDVFPGKFMEMVERLHFHRSVTHSLLFCLLAAPLLAWLGQKIHRQSSFSSKVTFKDWSLFFFLILITHAMLDTFTTWGTQLLWPFTDYGFALQSVFVIDPLYTLPFLFLLIGAIYFPKTHKKRRLLNGIGLTISTAYLLLTLGNKWVVTNKVAESLEQKQINYSRLSVRPTPFNNILWAANVEVDSGFYLGYYSLLQKGTVDAWHFVPKNHHLISDKFKDKKLTILTRMMKGFYVIEPLHQGWLINDLRFGTFGGWSSTQSPFVFSYIMEEVNGELIFRESKKTFDAKKSLNGLWGRMLSLDDS